MKLYPANQWPSEAFWENVEEAVEIVLKENGGGVADEIRELILKEWLAYSWPAGTA